MTRSSFLPRLILLASLVFAAGGCEDDDPTIPYTASGDSGGTDTGTDAGGDAGTDATPGEVDATGPCLGASDAPAVPTPLSPETNEYTAEIVEIFARAGRTLDIVDASPLPPSDATPVPPDGLSVFEGSTAYEWTTADGIYTYVSQDDTYSVYFEEEDGLRLGDERIYVDQSEACDRFRFSQYLLADEGEMGTGDAEAFFSFDQAGTALDYTFGVYVGAETWDHDLRIFEDGSGDAESRSDAGVRSFEWNADGSGRFELIVDGDVVEEVTW